MITGYGKRDGIIRIAQAKAALTEQPKRKTEHGLKKEKRRIAQRRKSQCEKYSIPF